MSLEYISDCSQEPANYIKFTVNNAQIDINMDVLGNNVFMLEYSKWVVIQQYLIRSIYIMMINYIDNLFDDDFTNIFTTYLKPYSNVINIDKFNIGFNSNHNSHNGNHGNSHNSHNNVNVLPDNYLTRFNCIEYIGYTNYNKLSMEYLHDSYIYGKFKKLNEYQKCITHLRKIYPNVNNIDHILTITHNNNYGTDNPLDINRYESSSALNCEYLKENYMDIAQDFGNAFELDDYLSALLSVMGIYPDRYKYIGYSRDFIRLSYYQINNIYELFKIHLNYNQYYDKKQKYSNFNTDYELFHSFLSRCANLQESEYNFTAQLTMQ